MFVCLTFYGSCHHCLFQLLSQIHCAFSPSFFNLIVNQRSTNFECKSSLLKLENFMAETNSKDKYLSVPRQHSQICCVVLDFLSNRQIDVHFEHNYLKILILSYLKHIYSKDIHIYIFLITLLNF